MNDVFEGKTFLKGIDLISRQIVSIKDPENLELVKTYFPQINRSHENMLPSGSNVYIGSLSVKEDSFPMWKVYAKNEKGCNIEFGEGFFDIDGVPYSPQNLRDYLISKYTDEDYPLYVVQYIDAKFEDECEKYLKENAGQEKFAPFYTGSRNQVCGTEAIGYRSLCGYLHQIFVHWEKLEQYLNKLSKDAVSASISSV